MNIKISDKQTHDFEFCLTAEMLETYGNELEGRPDGSGVIVKGTLRKKDTDCITVKMLLSGKMIYPCARCLSPVILPISFEYQDDFELAEGQDAVDLVPFVEECLYINEPYRVLCDETCKGLCPGCGVNLNEAQCQCDASPEIDPRLEALKQLL